MGTLGVAVAMATCVAVSAAEQGGWKFEVTPYAWLTGTEGDVTVRGQKADFDKSFSDLLDYVELGGSLRLRAEYNRFLVGGQVDYFSLSTDRLDVEDRPQGGELDVKTLLADGVAGYRVDGWAEGQSVDLMVGVRNLRMENDLEVYGHGTLSKDSDVTDAMFYAVPVLPVLPSKIDGLRFSCVLGIGAGESDLSYELFPELQYQVTKTIDTRLGYRLVGWKFEDGDNELNVRMAGLIAGLGITF
jgi:hypothetical protein